MIVFLINMQSTLFQPIAQHCMPYSNVPYILGGILTVLAFAKRLVLFLCVAAVGCSYSQYSSLIKHIDISHADLVANSAL